MIKVIIADDEEHVCRLIRSLVDWESLGMGVVGIARDGVEALGLVQSEQPDLMITDIRMPGYDGLEMIRRAQLLKADLDFIIISGYRHFEYAQNAIKYGVGDYLLKPIKKEDLLAALGKMRDRYRERTERLTNEERLKTRVKSDAEKLRAGLFRECLLPRGEAELPPLQAVNEAYRYSFRPGMFQVCAVKIDCGSGDQFNSAVGILDEKAEQILTGMLREVCFDMGTCRDDCTVYCVLNFAPDDRAAVHRRLKAVTDELLVQKAVFGQTEFTVCAGTAVGEIGRLGESFQAANWAVGQRLIAGTGGLIEGEAPRPEPPAAQALRAELNKGLASALEVLDRQAALACIEALKNGAVSAGLSGQQIVSLAGEACELYLMHLRNNRIPVQYGDEFLEKFRVHAGRCGTVGELFGYLSLTVSASLDVIVEEKKQQDTRPIRLAKQYIRQNYTRPIGLEEVSGYVGFSPTYFSTLFKKESGSNFVDYLSEIRMDRAKELLKETNLSVASICEQVGYSDLKHFTKSFRSYTGLKPNEYRKLYS